MARLTNKILFAKLSIALSIALSTALPVGLAIGIVFGPRLGLAQSAVVDVKLSPAGSFKIKSNEVKGSAEMKGDVVEAHDVRVGLAQIDTGISLRTDHTKKHLETAKYPEAVLVSAKGKGGKGSGVLRIRDIEHQVTGTYKISGKDLKTLEASFPVKLSDYKFEGIKYMGVGVQDEIQLTVSVPLKK